MSVFSDVVFTNKGSKGNILGRGSFVVGESVKVQYTLFNGQNGPFVMLPSDKDRNGKTDEKTGKPIYYPHASFISKESRDEMNALVVKQWESSTNGESVDNSTSQVSDELPF